MFLCYGLSVRTMIRRPSIGAPDSTSRVASSCVKRLLSLIIRPLVNNQSMVGCSDQSDVEAGGGLVILFHAAAVAPACKRGVEQGNTIFAAVYAHRQVFGVSIMVTVNLSLK